jgi:hypothetical protein
MIHARPFSTGRRTPDAARQLARDGFHVLRRALPEAGLAALEKELDPRFRRTPFCEGLFSGRSTKRFHGLLSRSAGAANLVMHEDIIDIVEAILLPFADTIQLNLTQAIEIHPGAAEQVPHRDQDMWQGEKGRTEYLVNVMWPLTPFTAKNGGTRLWPGSQHCQDLRSLSPADAVCPELRPGDALLFLGSTLHGAGANLSSAVRRGVIVSYCLGWLKPYENMWLTYPPEVARGFSPGLQALVGYRLNRPNLGNFDGNCPSLLLRDGVPDHLPTRDAFLPAQLAALEQHAARGMA